VAEIVELVLDVTAEVVTVKLTVLAPAGTVTVDGTCAADVLELVSGTTRPPDGATPFMVRVPVAEVPPVTVDGATAMKLTVGAQMLRTALALFPLAVAVIVAFTGAATAEVVIVKVAEEVPAVTVTVAGT
jgi:hypothetical protein